MAKDQTQQVKDEVIDTTEKDEGQSTATAVKTSEDFDKKLDTEGIDESLSDDEASENETEGADKDSESEDDTGTADDKKDTGKTETEDEDKGGEDEFSQNLVDQAIDLGLKMEEIGLHKNDAELERTIEILTSIRPATQKPEEPAQAPAKGKAKDEGIKFEDEEAIDPEILNAVRSLEKNNKDLREMVERLTGSLEQKQQDEFNNKFDSLIENLGTDYEDVFGKGKGTELNKNSGHYRNRRTMIKHMYALASGYQAAKVRIPSEQDLFDQALYALHKKKMTSVRSRQISDKAKVQKGRRAGVPASSKTERPATGLQKAYQTSRKFDEMIDTSE